MRGFQNSGAPFWEVQEPSAQTSEGKTLFHLLTDRLYWELFVLFLTTVLCLQSLPQNKNPQPLLVPGP